MNRKFVLPAMVAFLLLGVYGCNSPDSAAPATTPPTATSEDSDHDHDAGEHDGHDHDAHEHDGDEHAKGDAAQKSDMEKMTETLASFSEEDRESAMKQHFCPVSDKMLGTMGAPKKVDVDGQSVWICCDGCKAKLLADPDTYLAKLKD